jgi:hypothetical protein
MKPSALRTGIKCLALCLIAHPAVAQVAFTLDGSGTRVAYGESPGTTTWSLSPGFQLVRPWHSLSASGTYAQFPGGTWSLLGQALGSAFGPPVLGLRGELEGAVSGTLQQGQGRTSEYLGTLRLHRLGTRVGAWAGGSLGEGWNGTRRQTIRRGEVGGWIRLGQAALSMTISPTAIGDDVRYAELESTLQLTSGTIEIVGSGGLRHWSQSNTAWAIASASYWLSQRVALVLSGGTYPADYAQGLPQGTYGSLGFRLATRRPAFAALQAPNARPLAPDHMPPATVPAFAVRRGSGEMVNLTLTGPEAATVEIMGDFTGWSPVALVRVRGDSWAVTLPIPPGAHRINVRVNGGGWGVPPGVPILEDEFSGAVGLLVIE